MSDVRISFHLCEFMRDGFILCPLTARHRQDGRALSSITQCVWPDNGNLKRLAYPWDLSAHASGLYMNPT
jgi:hypothetical protein